MSQAFRLSTTYQQAPLAIDRKAGVLRGITAMQAGIEALGHGVQADMQTLHLLAGLGNADPDGIRTRFGHPGVSENATGKKVAAAKNFRVEGDRLIHDSYLLETARKSPVFAQDPIEYILDMAEKTPKELGESVVINANSVWTLDDGVEVDADDVFDRPDNATTPLPVLRPVNFYFVDFVGEPALVRDGLTPMAADAINYLFGGRASEYAQEMFRIVDEWRERYHIPLQAIPGKVDQIVSEYMAARSGRSTEMARKLKFDEAEVEPVAAPPPAEADPTEDDLDAAEATTAENDEALVEAEVQQQRIVLLEAIAIAQAETISRLKALARKHSDQIKVLERNFRNLSGERNVTEKVSRNAQPPLEDFESSTVYAHPTPRYQMAAPQHVTEHTKGVQKTGDSWRAGVTRQMTHNRAERQQAGGR